jgi:hypothetical protein
VLEGPAVEIKFKRLNGAETKGRGEAEKGKSVIETWKSGSFKLRRQCSPNIKSKPKELYYKLSQVGFE